VTVTWRGADDVDAGLTAGMGMAGDALLSNTLPLVPEDQGDLKASGTVTTDGDQTRVSFGTEYAVMQHQRTRYNHDTGQAKFLATAADAFGSEFEQILAEQARRVIGE
jgi:hypothetical protein